MGERPFERGRPVELGWARGALMIVFATNLLQFGSIELATGSVGRVVVDSLGRGDPCASETPDDGRGLLVSLEQHYVRAFERASVAVATPDTPTSLADPRAITSRSLKAAEALGGSIPPARATQALALFLSQGVDQNGSLPEMIYPGRQVDLC